MRTFVIYKYTNKINGKQYVGQTRNLQERNRKHLTNAKNPTHPSIIDRAIAKYGIENFTLEVIEYVGELFADEAEVFWIQELNTLKPNGYNLATGGKSPKGWKHSDAAKEKMSKNRKRLYGKDNPLFGKPLSQEHKDKVSKARTGMRISPQSPEDKKKKSEALKEYHKQKRIARGIDYDEIRRLYFEEKYGIRRLARKFTMGDKTIKKIVARLI